MCGRAVIGSAHDMTLGLCSPQLRTNYIRTDLLLRESSDCEPHIQNHCSFVRSFYPEQNVCQNLSLINC